LDTQNKTRTQQLMAIVEKFGPLVALLIVIIIFSFADMIKYGIDDMRFLSFRNFSNIIQQSITIAIAAIGMTFIIISAGIDLSVGSVVALAGVYCTMVITQLLDSNMGIFVAMTMGLVIGMLTGALAGMVNGMIINWCQLPPFIVTLGMLEIARGVALESTGGNTVTGLPSEFSNIANSVLVISSEYGIMIPYSIFILIAVALGAAFILKFTVFGMQVYAIGSNENTARLCGIHVERVKLGVYMLGGLAAGIAGILHASRLNTGQPSEARGMELEVIAAVVIGGGSLMGGVGTVLGSVLGALIIRTLSSGCNIMGVSSFVQRIVIGLIIIIAVYIDQLRRKASEAKGN